LGLRVSLWTWRVTHALASARGWLAPIQIHLQSGASKA